jgi:hypothetical protein
MFPPEGECIAFFMQKSIALDYTVSFDRPSDSFRVLCRKGGCFEGAYRCLERWIESKAEELDGLRTVPDSSLDFRRVMNYWWLFGLDAFIRP